MQVSTDFPVEPTEDMITHISCSIESSGEDAASRHYHAILEAAVADRYEMEGEMSKE